MTLIEVKEALLSEATSLKLPQNKITMDQSYIILAILTMTIRRQVACLDVRLSGGLTAYEGRVEVLHGGQWGSVCDDKWTHVNCMVVCSQLNYGGGTMLHDADAYGTCTGPILLDDVECDGTEHELGECRMANFGVNNCDHKEDVGCKCDPNPNPQGTCLPTHHRIHSVDASLPWVGRVEVYNGTNWGLVCDDDWDDIDAHVFCSCLGTYNNSSHYRSYWSPELASLPSLPMAFDSIDCNQVDKLSLKSIWECHSLVASEKCKSSAEAAGVACGPIPPSVKPEAPTVNLTCETGMLTACFTSKQYVMTANYLSINDACQQAVARNVTDGVCYDINMMKCSPVEVVSDASHKHFCYDLSYTQFDSNNDTLLTDNVWTRRTCCSQGKNGTAMASFRPLLIPVQPPVYSVSSVNFTMGCFTDESFTGSLITSSTVLTRGEDVYCRVTTDVWDSNLYLIVPTCKFYGSITGTPAFTFLYNKCPTTEVLDLSYYSFEKHSWGFKFSVPKFQQLDELYVSCDAYVCDPGLDQKPYCDRSCVTSSRRRRSLSKSHSGSSTLKHIVQGPFKISDSGFGPLLVTSSQAVLVETPSTGVYGDIPKYNVLPPVRSDNSKVEKTATKIKYRYAENSADINSVSLPDSSSCARLRPSYGKITTALTMFAFSIMITNSGTFF